VLKNRLIGGVFIVSAKSPLSPLALLSVIAWLLSLSTTNEAVIAQQPLRGDHDVVAKIVGPTKSEPGDLIVLDASSSVNVDVYKWMLANSSKSFLPVEGGTKLVFASGTPGDYKFILAVAGLHDGKADLSVAEHIVTNGRPGPTPPSPPTPPEPNPPTPPTPPVPPTPSLIGFAKLAYEEGTKVAQPYRGMAELFSRNFDVQRRDLELTPTLTVEEANANLKTMNQAVINAQPNQIEARAAWLPFFTAWKNEADKSLKTKDQYMAAFDDTAKGLGKVPKSLQPIQKGRK
jgi:hypothetical protein